MQIQDKIKQSIAVKEKIIGDTELLNRIRTVAEACILSFKNGGKVLFCGNGGSAADAQHLAAELSGKFYINREPLDAEALHVNTSYLTAVANDFGFNEVFSRLLKAKGKKGDVLIALSTSGSSPNIIDAVEIANKLGMITVGLTGDSGGKIKKLCNFLINVPSSDIPRIQESHIMIGHIICEIIETNLFAN